MKEFVISEVKAETAILVGLITQEQNEAKTKEYLDELEFLADTAGADREAIHPARGRPQPDNIRGQGKARRNQAIYPTRRGRRAGNRHGDIR